VRIDAFPHLLAVDPDRVWTIHSDGQDGDWGSRRGRHLARGRKPRRPLQGTRRRGRPLTSYKHDADNVRMRIRTTEDYAQLWLATLWIIEAAGLLDAILYVDLGNEFSNAKMGAYLYGFDATEPDALTSPDLLDARQPHDSQAQPRLHLLAVRPVSSVGDTGRLDGRFSRAAYLDRPSGDLQLL
jgi:hypothetical protein